jgi:hypothetical protein
MKRRRLESIVLASAILALTAGASAQTEPPADRLAIFGAGKVGSWTTELTLSNPRTEPSTVEVKTSPGEIVCVLPCDFTHEIPGRGTIVLGPPPPDGIGVTYVSAVSGSLPRVLARVLDGIGRSVDLPVFRLSTLLALDAPELVFPGAQRWAEGNVNLVVASIWDPARHAEPVTLRLEAFDANGISLGARDVALAAGETRFMGDALGFLGVSVVEVGQLSARRVGGSGKFWGTLSILRADGSLSVSAGALP